MKKVFQLLLLTLSAVLIFNSCEDKNDSPQLSFSVDSLEIASKSVVSAGDSFYVVIKSNVNWNVSVSKTWCSISLTRGENDQVMKVTIPENPTFNGREALITITGNDGEIVKTLSVSQIGEVKMNISSDSILSVAPTNATASFTLDANVDWTITSDQTWCKVSESTGNGDYKLNVTCTNDTLETDRQAILTITGGGLTKHVTVNQSGGVMLLEDDFSVDAQTWIINETVNGADSIIKVITNGYYEIDNQRTTMIPGFRKTDGYTSADYGRTSLLVLNSAADNFIFEAGIRFVSGNEVFGLFVGGNGTYSFYEDPVVGNYVVRIMRVGRYYYRFVNGVFVSTSNIVNSYGQYLGFVVLPGSKIQVDYVKIRSLSK
jgi:hypothetical protein